MGLLHARGEDTDVAHARLPHVYREARRPPEARADHEGRDEDAGGHADAERDDCDERPHGMKGLRLAPYTVHVPHGDVPHGDVANADAERRRL